jgi:hypothetical protein
VGQREDTAPPRHHHPVPTQGINIPNRVVIADAVKAGDKAEIAIFGINGPISVVPPNFVFFGQASVEFYK